MNFENAKLKSKSQISGSKIQIRVLRNQIRKSNFKFQTQNFKFGFGKKNTVGNDANRTFCLHGGNNAGSPYETFISELTSTLGYNDGDTVLMTIIDERYILPGVSLDEGGD